CVIASLELTKLDAWRRNVSQNGRDESLDVVDFDNCCFCLPSSNMRSSDGYPVVDLVLDTAARSINRAKPAVEGHSVTLSFLCMPVRRNGRFRKKGRRELSSGQPLSPNWKLPPHDRVCNGTSGGSSDRAHRGGSRQAPAARDGVTLAPSRERRPPVVQRVRAPARS